MRRLEWKGVLTGAVVMFLLTGVVYAASGTVPAQLLYENIRIFLDGDELVPKDANGVTVEPFIIDGTTYVPIRAISEAYDKEVSWDDEKKEIHINSAGQQPEEETPPQAADNMQEAVFLSVVLPGGQKVYPLFMRDVALVGEDGTCYAAQTTLYRVLTIAKYEHRILDVANHPNFKGFDEAIDFELGQEGFTTMGAGAADGALYDENAPSKKYFYSASPSDGQHLSYSYKERAYLSITDVLDFFEIPYESVSYDSAADNVVITLK